MATQPGELPSAKSAATIYSTDAHSPTGATETPEAQHYPEVTEETRQGFSFVTIFLLVSAIILVALIAWRVAIMLSIL